MRVSIITPTYNRAALLPETIESVLNQGYSDLEYIVIDDGSTDDTAKVLARYAGRIRVEQHENIGETATVNKGFSLATGEIICVVCSDDPLLPGLVHEVVEAFKKNTAAAAVYPDWMEIGPASECLQSIHLPDYDIQNMMTTISWGIGPGAFFKRDLIDKIGSRNADRIYCGDMEFWAKAALCGPLVHIPKALATHRTHPDSASVGKKSLKFAKEWVDTFRTLLSHPSMPASVLENRDWILAKAYLAARHYSGNDLPFSWVFHLEGIGFKRFLRIVFFMNLIVVRKLFSEMMVMSTMSLMVARKLFSECMKRSTRFLRGCYGSGVTKSQYLIEKLSKAGAACRKGVSKWGIESKNVTPKKPKKISPPPKSLTERLSALKQLPRALARAFFFAACKFLMLCMQWRLDIGRSQRRGLPPITVRFAICTRFTPPLWSGQAVVIGRLLGGLPPESYCMISLPLYQAEKEGGVEFTSPLPGKRHLLPPEKVLPYSPLPGKWRWRWKQFTLLAQAYQRGLNIAKIVHSDSVDTIVGCSGDLLDLPAAWIASCLTRKRFIVYFFDDYTEQWWADPVSRAFASRIERFVVKKADKVLVTNEHMRKELLSRHGKDSEIIRNPCGLSSTDKVIASTTVLKEISLVFTGAVYHLNYDILRSIIDSFDLIGDVRCHLHIYTAQPRNQLEAEGLVGSCVTIHEHVEPGRVAEIQRNADILLIPFSFKNEAKGIIRTAATAKLADYLAAGRSVLALCPEDSFLAWFLKDRDCGLVVSDGRIESIADAIRSVAMQPELRLRIHKNALTVAQKEFSPAVSQRNLIRAISLSFLPDYLRIPSPESDTNQLKVVQVSANDLLGIQVNGFLTHKWMHEHGHASHMLVYRKQSTDETVLELGSTFRRDVNSVIGRVEAKYNSTAVMPILSRELCKNKWVNEADVVNLHLVHAAPFFSLLDLPRLTKAKKVVLSVHDMFFMTGHCTYSMDCERWKIGCGDCPDLGLPFPLSKDVTARNWKLKHRIFQHSDLNIVVGSKWQEERVRQSPILNRFPCHMIPYGIDTRVFKPLDKKAARRILGIPENAQVIAFRSAPFHRNFKGTNFIEEALKQYEPSRPTTLLTFEGIGGLQSLREKYQFHELGWLTDSEKIALGLQAADIFLMPSIAEAFGLMAIESMACGTPVIVFDGTALPDTIGGRGCGVVVPQGDSAALADAIETCLASPEKLDMYRENGLKHVAAKHTFEGYARRYFELYQKLAMEH